MFEVVQMQRFTENWYGAPPAKNKICAVRYAADKIIGSITCQVCVCQFYKVFEEKTKFQDILCIIFHFVSNQRVDYFTNHCSNQLFFLLFVQEAAPEHLQ